MTPTLLQMASCGWRRCPCIVPTLPSPRPPMAVHLSLRRLAKQLSVNRRTMEGLIHRLPLIQTQQRQEQKPQSSSKCRRQQAAVYNNKNDQSLSFGYGHRVVVVKARMIICERPPRRRNAIAATVSLDEFNGHCVVGTASASLNYVM